MLRHILLFRWAEKSRAEERQNALDGLRSLPGLVPEIRSLKVSESLGLSPCFDGLLEIEIDDPESFGRYVSNEGHQKVWREALQPVWADMAMIQVAG